MEKWKVALFAQHLTLMMLTTHSYVNTLPRMVFFVSILYHPKFSRLTKSKFSIEYLARNDLQKRRHELESWIARFNLKHMNCVGTSTLTLVVSPIPTQQSGVTYSIKQNFQWGISSQNTFSLTRTVNALFPLRSFYLRRAQILQKMFLNSIVTFLFLINPKIICQLNTIGHIAIQRSSLQSSPTKVQSISHESDAMEISSN